MNLLYIIIAITLWFLLGALGVAICRKRWFEIFGDYRGVEWGRGLNVWTILIGPIGLLSSLLYYSSRRT